MARQVEADVSPEIESEDASAAPSSGGRLRRVATIEFERFALLIVFGLVILLFALLPVTSANFLTTENLSSLVSEEAVPLAVSLAILVPIIGREFDISVGANLGLCSIVAAGLMERDHFSAPAAILAATALGVAVGCINGFLVAIVGINSLIATIGMQTVIAGIVSFYSGDESIASGIAQSVTNAGVGSWIGVPKPIWYVGILAIVLYYVIQHTPYGRYLMAIGSNPRAARLVGVKMSVYTFSTFVVAGGIAGAAGVLQLAQSGSASPQVGPDFTLIGLSAVFLGSTTWRPGRFNVPGTILSVFFVATIVDGLVLAGASDWVQSFCDGAALLVAVALAIAIRRRRRRGRLA